MTCFSKMPLSMQSFWHNAPLSPFEKGDLPFPEAGKKYGLSIQLNYAGVTKIEKERL
jgi:hypothetical protein